MNTQLYVYTTSGTVLITSGTIDLYDDIPMSLNYNIADIKTPQNRDADYSKTITVPGTNNNNNLLAHIYEIGIDRLFNPNHKTEARILYDSVGVFKGYMRLTKIRKLKDEKVEYDLELRGRLDDLFTNLMDKRVADLSWTDLNHTWNKANIVNSWTGTLGSNYVYPFIDYGFSQNPAMFDVTHFFPATYFKEIWDRVFAYAGFQYSSTFLTSTFFKGLIMPFTGEAMRLTTAQIAARDFKASRLTTDLTFAAFSVADVANETFEYFTNIFNDDTTGTNIDGGNNYGTGTGIYTVPATGHYSFTANMNCHATALPNVPTQYINYQIWAYPRLIVNGVAKSYGNKMLMQFGNSTYSTVQTSNSVLNNTVTFTGQFNIGDTVYVDYQARTKLSPKGVASDIEYKLVLEIGSYFYGNATALLSDGDTITYANTFPAEMKIVDWMVSVMKTYNLYFEYDKDTPNKIYIEPRNDYYNSTVQDWSAKLDASQEPEIIPMGALNAKRYRFTYKEDGDELNQIYKKTYGENYGEHHSDIDNDFLKNIETFESIFSASPQYNVVGTQRYYPAIYYRDSSMKSIHKAANVRMLYYGGMKTCASWWLQSSIAGGQSFTQYPYCGMMDDPDAPTFTLDFGIPKEVYYVPSWQATYSDNNIFNKYWSQFIAEISDYNSSIITASFWLKPTDIMQVDFRHAYYFLGQEFRLNKIIDYNPSEVSLTKCEFIKLKTGIPFVKKSPKINGSSNDAGTGTSSTRLAPSPPYFNNQGGNGAYVIGDTQNIVGTSNYVAPDASNIQILGNSNSIGTAASNISILNSSGCIVAGGLTNVSILNSSGITVLTSNTTVINGVVTYSPTTSSGNEWTTSGTIIYNTQLGNVGVGTNNPSVKLHVYNNTAGKNNYIVIENTIPTQQVGLNITNSGTANADWIAYIQSSTSDLRFYNGGTSPGDRIGITNDGRFYGSALHNNAGAVTGTTSQYVASGTYTPTAADTSNITGTPSPRKAQWIRVGNVVTVSGEVDNIVPTAAGVASFSLTIPIASTFSTQYELGGTAFAQSGSNIGGSISGGTTKAAIAFLAPGTSSFNFNYTFQYEIL